MNYFVIAGLLTSMLGIPKHEPHRQLVEIQTPQRAVFDVPAGRTPSIETVHDDVVLAATARGWRLVADQPGQITLHTEIRGKHRIDVRVTYDQQAVQVDYLSSENLNYRSVNGVGYIHPRYNDWAAFLLQDIVAKVTFQVVRS